MRTWHRSPWMVLLLSVLLAGSGLFLTSRAGAVPMPGINGDVYDSANNQIIGAVVRVYRNGVQVDQQTTIGSGHFMFTTGTITEGLHKVTAEAPGFITGEQWVTVQFGSSEPIVFTLATQTPPTGSLEVTVQDDGGSPISGATIGLYDLTDQLLDSAFSASNGKFTFYGLAPATYTVYVQKTGYTGSPMTSPAVTAGTTQTMTVTLTPETPPGSITVQLTNYADGLPLTGAEVRLDNEGNGHPVLADGTYTFTGVADGPHTVTVTYATRPNALFSVTVSSGQPAALNAGLWYDAWVEEMDGTVAQATTLPGSRLVNGNLSIDADLNLNGQTLWVNGSVHHGSGTLALNGGRLEATGEYRMQAWQGADWGLSTGRLIMTNPADTLKVGGDMVVQSNQSMSTTPALTNGTIELGGSFTQTGWLDNFYAQGSHTVRFASPNHQYISFSAPGSSGFNNVLIQMPDQVHFLGELNAARIEAANGGPTSVYAQKLAENRSFTVHQDLLIWPEDTTTEDIRIDTAGGFSPTVSIAAGKKLTLMGNLVHAGGLLDIGAGKLEITGDYLLQNRTWTQDGQPVTDLSSGTLRMAGAGGHLLVRNDMVVQTAAQDEQLQFGTLELQGHFTQKQAGTKLDNFSALASHTTRLSGFIPAPPGSQPVQRLQDVNFENPGPSHFGRLEIANQGNVSFFQEINATGEIRGGFLGPVRIRAAKLAAQTALTLYQDLEVEPLDNVNAVELAGASVNLNGRTLVVRGDLSQTGGQLRINKGALLVERPGPASPTAGGNYILTATTPTDGLIMQSDADLVRTRGSVTIQSSQDTVANDFLTAGVMLVEGDFTQKIAGTWGGNFNARGTHKVILRGPNPQTVTFESPGPGGSVLNELEIRTHEPVRFIGGINARRLTGESQLRVKAGVLTRASDLVLTQDMLVLPDSGSNAVVIEGARLRLNGYRLIIGERNMPVNLIQSGGALEIENGILDVSGDYRLETPGATVGDSDGQLFMQDPEGLLLVRGSFVTRSRSSATVTPHLSAGTMEVQGNFTQQSATTLQGGATVRDNFKATGAHTVRLAGWQPQQVSLGSSPDSGFANLIQYNCQQGNITYAPTDVGLSAVNACSAQVAVTAVNGGSHRNGNVTLVFNRRLRSQEPDYSRVTLTTDGALVPFRLYTDSTWMHLEPRQPLKPGATFVVTVPKDIAASDTMAADFTFTFSTAPSAGRRLPLQGIWFAGTPFPVGGSIDHIPTGEPVFTGNRLVFLQPDGTLVTSPTDLQGMAPDSRMAVIREAAATAGFVPGDVYLSSGIPGKIARWQPGDTFTAEWASLPPAATGNIAALTWDRFGSWGNALIAITSTGEIWTFDSSGVATQTAASVAGIATAAATVPGAPAYGDLAGRLLVGTFDGKVYAIQGSTAALVHDFGHAISDLELIPAGENLYGVDRGQGTVTAPASAFSDYAGRILVALERPGRLLTLRHTATGFEIMQIGESLWWSDLTFSPMAAPPRPANPAWLGGSARAQYRKDSLGIAVTLKQGATVVATKPTDTTGRFDFQNLAEGTYVLEARRDGHLIRSITIVIAGGEVVTPFYPISLWLRYGDLNGDGAITRVDAHMLDSYYNTTWAQAADPNWFNTLDANNNQVIDISEYVLLLLNATE